MSSKGVGYIREVEIKFKRKRIEGGEKLSSISNAEQIYEIFKDLENESKEKLLTVNLDIKNRILCFELVALGSLGSIYTRPMEVFRTSFSVNAYAAIVVHNHPSGDVEPSDADKVFTEEIAFLAKKMGLKFYDHVIIGAEGYFSFAESGLLGES